MRLKAEQGLFRRRSYTNRGGQKTTDESVTLDPHSRRVFPITHMALVSGGTQTCWFVRTLALRRANCLDPQCEV